MAFLGDVDQLQRETADILVFVTGSIGFYFLGSNRFLSIGADSAVAPIFAASLHTGNLWLAAILALCAMFALLVGCIVIAAGVFRIGWIARRRLCIRRQRCNSLSMGTKYPLGRQFLISNKPDVVN